MKQMGERREDGEKMLDQILIVLLAMLILNYCPHCGRLNHTADSKLD